MKENEFKILNLIRKKGILSYREIAKETEISLGNISTIIKGFKENKLIDSDGITDLGMKKLQPYKVNNAVILAAGPSSRFVPLSLEMPKGLFKVRGKVLIERQIEQLKEAGIDDITVVLGYKKELFFYLKDKYNVNIIINDEFNKKNNIESIYKAKNRISSTYICSCDNYFTINPFDTYEYQAFYASIYCNKYTKEFYVKTNAKGIITNMSKGQANGDILLGPSFWNKKFSTSFINLIEKYHESGEYDNDFWEKLLVDNLKTLTISAKKYPDNTIFEFDSLEELRAFDDKYINNTESKIMANICLTFNCDESDITGFKPIHEGLTNTSFIFELKGKRYVYRQPGDGTDAIINRNHEKKVLIAAKKYGFDPTYIYMSEKEGWKISSFVESFREPDYSSFDDTLKVIDVLKKLHKTNAPEIDWIFDPISEADKIEVLIKSKTKIQMNDFEELKERIHLIYEKTIGDGIGKCFCHCDTYKPNWMLTPTGTILIDWEYSGRSDPGIDIGYYIVDAMYDFETAEKIVKAYCGEEYNETLRYHYFAYTAIIAYYWFVWALYRELCGAPMGEALYNWYIMAKKFSVYICENMLSSKENKSLSRYEFEVLKYIEENNIVSNDSRFLSNTLLLSNDNVKATINTCIDKQYIHQNENNLTITKYGLSKLEPYKVSRAIIMAAGFGSRMAPVTLETPKPLIKVNGVRIIDTLLDSLIAHDIKDIYIIRGYKKEKFDELLEKYPFIKFIDNDDFNKTNNISSIAKAIDYVDNCYICEADFLISNKNIISKYHYQSNYLGTRVIETDDWSFRSVDGYAEDYKKGNTNCYQAYGISYWNKEDSAKIRKDIMSLFSTQAGKEEFWESCVFNFYKDDFKIEINNCSKFDIVEIDNFSELVEIDDSYKNYR